jgi:lipopolysaccharide biosynthesis regulator YciM
MFTVFDRPFNLRPVKVYKQISQDYPDSPLAPVAQLKLAMWYLFNDKSLDALKAAQEFEKRFAESDLLPRSRQVGRQAFEKLASRAFKEKDFARILDLWNRFSFLQQEQDKLAPETRLAVAMSHWKEGQAQKAISMAKPFLEEGKTDQYAERALDLLLTIYLEQNKWQKIADLENKITKPAWSDKHKAQFKYALALAYENLGDTQKSLPLWKDVAEHKKLTSTQRGYAYYFLAQESMQQDSLEDVNDYAQAAVSELWDTGKDQAKILDCLDWLIEVNRRSGRLQQALRWAREYEKLITKDHPDWPSFRYRYAELYKELGDVQMWEQILRNLQETKPDSFYGRMAASDLENQDLMQQAGQYLNP